MMTPRLFEHAGTIVFISKNSNAWRNLFRVTLISNKDNCLRNRANNNRFLFVPHRMTFNSRLFEHASTIVFISKNSNAWRNLLKDYH